MTLIAVLLGFLAGLASVGFKALIGFFQKLFWAAPTILESALQRPWYLILLIPAIGGLLVAPLIRYGAPEAKGHGVPEILESLVLRGGRIKPQVVAVKALASSICISSGGSVGREGPIVQISSALASSLGRLLKIDERGMKTLVAAGAAGGIGATFNAPIAGALFAVEILLGEFGVYSFSPIIVTSVIATLTSRFISGDFAAFQVPQYTLTSLWEIGPYVVLGIVSGFVAILFIKSLYFLEDKFEALKAHPLIKPVIGGLLVGCIGLFAPQIFGVSYESIDACLQNNVALWLALILIFAKILSTSLTLGSGGSGGIFAPSLFLGAMTGNVIGSAFHQMFPQAISMPGAYALVGMGAVVAAATHAPITAIIIIFELTGDYNIILPLMLSCIIASLITVGLHKESIYTMKLRRRGIRFKEGREMNILRSLSVKDFMSSDFEVFINSEQLGGIIDRAISGTYHTFQIVDHENSYVGCFSLNHLKKIVMDKELLGTFIIAEDIAVSSHHLDSDSNLEDAMKIFGRTDVGEIPVLQDGKLAGVVKRKDVIEAYNHELIKREATSGLVQKIKFTQETQSVDMGGGYKIMEVESPSIFHNKSLKDLELKAVYRIDILLIRRKFPPQTITLPRADEVIQPQDVLVIAGLEENVDKILRK
ncbi:chloride channel protein [Acidobacteriota bacterium]